MTTTISGSSGGTAVTTTTLTALVPPSPPQGRLTLTSATPVLTATVSASATVYYALYTGNQIPIYSGTAWVMTTFTELSNATAQSSTGNAGPAAVAANSNYDLFAWSNGGTLTLTRGPPFTSDTVRGTGAGTTQISRVLGIWSNTVAITNGPGAGLGTYVGTVRSNGTATVDWIFGATASGGTAGVLGVWNMYNRVDVASVTCDSVASYSVANGTTQAANNSAGNRCSFIRGLDEDAASAIYESYAGSQNGLLTSGIGLDSTTTYTKTATNYASATSWSTVTHYDGLPGLGWHYLSPNDTGSVTNSFNGTDDGYQVMAFRYHGRH